MLFLSDNGLSGALPHCLGNLADTLVLLFLGNNQIRGTIPTTFTKSCRLEVVNMHSNHFEGPFPQALANCEQLKILDIGNNKISGTFPAWLIPLPQLEVLILRSNRLHGTISGTSAAHPFPKLRIMDLSNNEFTGYLPIQHFNNMKPIGKMFEYTNFTQYYYYQSPVSLIVKGREYEVKKILYMYTAIDLSCNRFQGQVPNVTGELRWLALLNLSHNSLTGPIPSLLGNMESLQSLDLSCNQLTGVIPHQLTSLTYLAALNLSENNLTGEIPQKGQFSTFNNDSYIGNSALCGSPLTKKCIPAGSPPQEVEYGDEDNEFDWEVILMGYGIGLICGLSTGYIVFKIEKPWWFLKYIEGLQQKLKTRFTKNSVVLSRRA